jgi:hypothetical protein
VDLEEIKETDIWTLYDKSISYCRLIGMYGDTDLNYRMYNGDQWYGLKVKGVDKVQYNFIKPIVKYKVGIVLTNLYAINFSSENFERKDLRKAYDLYQDYLEFNSTSTLENARERLDKLIDAYKASRIKQYIPAWKMLENWHDEIINSFSRVNGRRVTNGPMERANENIKTIFRLAYGARNFERMRNRIMFVMNSDSPTLYEPKKYTNKHKYHKRGHYNKNK